MNNQMKTESFQGKYKGAFIIKIYWRNDSSTERINQDYQNCHKILLNEFILNHKHIADIDVSLD